MGNWRESASSIILSLEVVVQHNRTKFVLVDKVMLELSDYIRRKLLTDNSPESTLMAQYMEYLQNEMCKGG